MDKQEAIQRKDNTPFYQWFFRGVGTWAIMIGLLYVFGFKYHFSTPPREYLNRVMSYFQNDYVEIELENQPPPEPLPEDATILEKALDLIPARPKTIAIPLLPKNKNEAKKIIAEIVAEETKGVVNSIIIDALIEQESNYNQFAKSNVGALGLTQIMPRQWAEKCGLKQVEELYDPRKNVRCGVAIFRDALAMSQRTSKTKDFEVVLRNAFKYYNCSPKNALRNAAARKYSNEVMAKIDHRLRRSLWAKPEAWKDRSKQHAN